MEYMSVPEEFMDPLISHMCDGCGESTRDVLVSLCCRRTYHRTCGPESCSECGIPNPITVSVSFIQSHCDTYNHLLLHQYGALEWYTGMTGSGTPNGANGILGLDTGLGKTPTSLACWQTTNKVKLLVLCPKTTVG